MSLTFALAKEFFHYCPTTGELRWLKSRNNRCRVGERAGTLNVNGVWQLCFDHKTYFQHRIAWLYMTGDWPKQVIDHIDGDPSNNRWANLRDVSQSVNRQNLKRAAANNVSGLLGVFPLYGKWYCSIKLMGVNVRTGPFESAQLAHNEYLETKRLWHEGCSI
jgi:hypothetical protein